MRIAGSNVVDQPVDKVWEALLDPRVLVATIPGCERLEATGENAYAMTVTAGVAAIKGTYDGSCALSDLRERESLTMRLQGAGAPGTVDATVQVRFSEPEPGRTEISYDADAVVGGMVGGVGQRMLGSVSKRMAGEFFGAVDTALAGGLATAPAAAEAGQSSSDRAMPGVYVDAPRTGTSQEFLRGIAVGAGLVLLGVVAGRLGSRQG